MTKILKFKNGATLLYERRKDFNVTAMRAGFFAGHLYNAGQFGLPHLVEHMLCSQTKKRSPEKMIEDRAKVFGFNACTSPKTLLVVFSSPNKWVENGFEYTSDCLLNSAFDDKLLENEKKVVLEELGQNLNNHQFSFNYHSFNFTHQYDELTDKFRLGDQEIITSFTVKDLENFRDKNFVSDKFIISVCSSLPFYKIKKLVKKYYISNLKKPQEKSELVEKNYYTINKEQSLGILNQADKQNFKGSVMFTFDTEFDEFRDDPSMSFLRYVLDNKNGYFYREARKEGLIYDASVSLLIAPESRKSALCFDFTTNKFENIEKLIVLINKSIVSLKNGDLTEKDIVDCKDYLYVRMDTENYSRYMDDSRGMLDFYILRGNLKKRTHKQQQKAIDKVTLEKVQMNVDRVFDKNKDVIMFIHGNFDEKQLKTIEEYKEMLYKGI